MRNPFPIYITVSPQCWLGHNYSRWNARDTDGILKPYGCCKTCGKEKFWKVTNSEQCSTSYTESQTTSKGSPMDVLWDALKDDIWRMTLDTYKGLPVVVVAEDLLEYLEESGVNPNNLKGIDMDEFIDLLDDWVFEGQD